MAKLDFGKRFIIGEGTGTHATLDTVEEVCLWLAMQDDLTRHFVRIYDTQEETSCFGSDFAPFWNVFHAVRNKSEKF